MPVDKVAKAAAMEAKKAAKAAEMEAKKAAKAAEMEAKKAAKAAEKAAKAAEKAAEKAAKAAAKKPVVAPKKGPAAKKPVAAPKKSSPAAAKKPVAAPKKAPAAPKKRVVDTLEKDLLILTNFCITKFEDTFQDMMALIADDTNSNIILSMKCVQSGDDVHVLLPDKYDKIIPLDEKVRKMIVPWEEDERFASCDGVKLILIASKETRDHICKTLWDTHGDILKKEKARIKKLK